MSAPCEWAREQTCEKSILQASILFYFISFHGAKSRIRPRRNATSFDCLSSCRQVVNASIDFHDSHVWSSHDYPDYLYIPTIPSIQTISSSLLSRISRLSLYPDDLYYLHCPDYLYYPDCLILAPVYLMSDQWFYNLLMLCLCLSLSPLQNLVVDVVMLFPRCLLYAYPNIELGPSSNFVMVGFLMLHCCILPNSPDSFFGYCHFPSSFSYASSHQ